MAMANVYRIVGTFVEFIKGVGLAKKTMAIQKSVNEVAELGYEPETLELRLRELARTQTLDGIKHLKKNIASLNDEYRDNKEKEDKLVKQKTNILNRVLHNFRLMKVRKNIERIEKNVLQSKQVLGDLGNNTEQRIEESYEILKEEWRPMVSFIDANQTLWAGLKGEVEAESELKKLSDSFHVINDFRYEFNKALHRKNEGDWIKSIQCDHVVIGPTGVFAIETKNWSKDSIQNLDLFSPVEQLQRHGYALFVLLNKAVSSARFFTDHFGTQQIPVRNVLLMTNAKPSKDYQHVRICTLSNLRPHIEYFEPKFDDIQTQQLTDFLLSICKAQ